MIKYTYCNDKIFKRNIHTMLASPNVDFDILEFVNSAKENGINQKFAESTARQIEKIQDMFKDQQSIIKEQQSEIEIIKSRKTAQRHDVVETELKLKKEIIEAEIRLQKEIEGVKKEIIEVEFRLQKEIMSTKIQTLIWIGANTAFMFGVMAKGFHWF